MGYGEAGGGGSLQWQMTHNNKKPGHVPPKPGKPQQRGEGIDPDVNDGDNLYVVINRGVVIQMDANQVVVRVKLTNSDDVQLKWGADAAALKALDDAGAITLNLSKLEASRAQSV
jgi:hypothetical protein